MAENIPPTTAATATGTATTAAPNTADPALTRGVPYYEKLRRELRETLQKKRLLDRNLASLEESIYRFEQSYLEETGAGNIIKGFDNYIKGSTGPSSLSIASALSSSFGGSGGGSGGGGGPITRRKAQVSDLDRVFSRSSASFMRDSPTPSSAHTTPSHAPTPTYSGPNSKADKDPKDVSASNSVKGGGGGGNSSGGANAATKNRKKSIGTVRERDVDDDGSGETKPPVKRLKITYGRGE
ncbi:chromatin modification- protein eaf6 [Emydomyces testavorans]|uniref:Chromatin modification-related protein EAF6 n=1 Tax=Emydomyces testavorans TaxID=2070801 RepID=A0AAF0IKN8_9EURO|nr:chromatin modification- protein eaf6 [Emydomyces testavorans]